MVRTEWLFRGLSFCFLRFPFGSSRLSTAGLFLNLSVGSDRVMNLNAANHWQLPKVR